MHLLSLEPTTSLSTMLSQREWDSILARSLWLDGFSQLHYSILLKFNILLLVDSSLSGACSPNDMHILKVEIMDVCRLQAFSFFMNT